ncbi:hypothetical protein [Dyadobacter sp. NIV53]|uniref:hypothetical protein n=1 Tax=Dyadobacter sp. NIV53 TaxID=2861765 RepID=UPI001C888025|nr:hypothetical protein [Dyadobacter sp. NIV53]
MKRSTRLIYGITIALITAASLHFTVGHRFHGRYFGHYGPNGFGYNNHGSARFSDYGCGSNEHDRYGDNSGRFKNRTGSEQKAEKSPLESAPAETPKDSF